MRDDVLKTSFEILLNQNSPEFESNKWIIAGKLRKFHRANNYYGTALRQNDPIAFNASFQEYEQKLIQKK